MPILSRDKLDDLPLFEDVDEALRAPDEVFRLRVYKPDDPSTVARIAEFSSLKSLSVSLADVSQLLPKLDGFLDLQEISLQACDIPSFPEGLLSLKNLCSLSIGNNSLEELPDDLVKMRQLESLHFTQNKLRKIPDNLGELTRLETLGLSYNELERIPETVGNLSRLEWLFLDCNRLEGIPEAIGKLKLLRSLSVNSNELRTLPGSVCELEDLESLQIQNNPFEELPECLSKFVGIRNFEIEAEKRSMFMDWSYQPSQKTPQLEVAELALFVSEDSEQFDPLISTIGEHKLQDFQTEILSVARQAVALESTDPDDYSNVGNSRLGGFPDLASASLFPSSKGLYWSFLAQIDLAEVARFQRFLPPSGLLSFFVDSTEDFHGRVIYHEGDCSELCTVRHGGESEMYDPSDDYTAKPHRVRFQPCFSLPCDPPDFIEEDDHYTACEELAETAKTFDHSLNGYTFTQHEGPLEQAANQMGGLAAEWVPLLSLGWDSNVGFCFWDAGTLSFSIHREDLRRWDFSKVHVSLESS